MGGEQKRLARDDSYASESPFTVAEALGPQAHQLTLATSGFRAT